MIARQVTSPKATALWLINNTALTFGQIAQFCGIHEMEVKSIADGVLSRSLREKNPITHGELTESTIKECEQNPEKQLVINGYGFGAEIKVKVKPKRYVSVAKRHNKPSAILWVVQNIKGVSVKEIRTITGATKAMVESIINGTHRHFGELSPKDPVSLGLCSQAQLNALIKSSQEEQK